MEKTTTTTTTTTKGLGMFCYPEFGSIYLGMYEKGKRHGFGVQTYSNGEVYEGEWHRGACTGWGTLRTNNNLLRYEGYWQVFSPFRLSCILPLKAALFALTL